MTNQGNDTHRILVWDLPTRIFHWLLVASFSAAWLTFDDNRYLHIHVFAGYVLFALLLFRLLWGSIGSHYARFRTFSYDWPSVSAYLKGLITGQAARHLGHNPAGSWAIFAILILGFVTSISGIVTQGGEERHGILAGLVSFQVGSIAREIHEITAWAMLGIVAMHVTGVIVESIIHKENLIASMISGYKEGGTGDESVTPRSVVAVLLFTVVFISALIYFRGYVTQTPEQPYRPFHGPELPDNALWRQECGDCHLAYHPTLLPARSWDAMLAGQDDHFGEELFLDEETVTELQAFLFNNAAESHLTEPAWKIDRSVPPTEIPLRITETRYWRNKHQDIDEQYWRSDQIAGKGDCTACHLDAEEGWFEDSAMRLPKLTSINDSI